MFHSFTPDQAIPHGKTRGWYHFSDYSARPNWGPRSCTPHISWLALDGSAGGNDSEMRTHFPPAMVPLSGEQGGIDGLPPYSSDGRPSPRHSLCRGTSGSSARGSMESPTRMYANVCLSNTVALSIPPLPLGEGAGGEAQVAHRPIRVKATVLGLTGKQKYATLSPVS